MYKITQEFLKKESLKVILQEEEVQENLYRVNLENGWEEKATINAENLFLIDWYIKNKTKEVENLHPYTPLEYEGIIIDDGVEKLKNCTECGERLDIDFPDILNTEMIEGKRSLFFSWNCIKCNSKLISLQKHKQ